MESTRPIRALMRGLDALTTLNSRDGATVSEVAQDIRLPRTTAYRILETLCDAGFAFRDRVDDRYRLTVLVRGLSGGFDDEAWVPEIVKPCIDALCREIVWPVSLSTLSVTAMMVRAATDHDTPLAIERCSAGWREPLLSSAAGVAYLAFCASVERDNLLDRLAASDREGDHPARVQRADLLRMLADARSQGYATLTRPRRLADELSLGVPVTLPDRGLAVLTVRCSSAGVPLKSDIERSFPKLAQCAARISASYAEKYAPARPRSEPVVAA
jgi:IclR family mhp operon transcriptional activator